MLAVTPVPLRRFLYLSAFEQGPVVFTLRMPVLAIQNLPCTASVAAILVCAPVFAFKQLTNVIQMFIAFDAINQFDADKRAKKM